VGKLFLICDGPALGQIHRQQHLFSFLALLGCAAFFCSNLFVPEIRSIVTQQKVIRMAGLSAMETGFARGSSRISSQAEQDHRRVSVSSIVSAYSISRTRSRYLTGNALFL
jgi:hypothetical protein